MFDPEKVQRYIDGYNGDQVVPFDLGKWVKFSDYDQLLQINQKILKQLHGARHGSIHSPDNLCIAHCPQCAEFFGGPDFDSSVIL